MTTASVLQQEARGAMREALVPFGYEADFLRFGWQVPNADAVRRYTEQEGRDPTARPSGRTRVLDALAFADSRKQDWHTSAIAIDLTQDDAVGTATSEKRARELFSLTAAPTNLVGSYTRNKVDIWFNCHDGIVGPESVDITPDALKGAFRRHRSSVQRDLLAHLRTGQHHLFDGALYARRDELANFLQRGVSKATWIVGTGDEVWGNSKDEVSSRREAFSRVALALLAARILEDKGALGEGRPQSSEARPLLAEASAKWHSFFDTVISQDLVQLDGWFRVERANLMLQCLLSHLTGPINFGLVTHEMLGDLYERALVAERSSRSDALVELKGVHYTPLAIAKRILDRIPLEDLPLADRTVCDLACGSGSFLLAATDRLAGLYHPREPGAPKDQVQWLHSAVMGNDIDPVAILVARLSYLVAYWNRVDDSKQVPFPSLSEGRDALTLDPVAAFKQVPSVIVGNPPFDGAQPVGAFLERALNLLHEKQGEYPRYLGMVMPGAFLTGKPGLEAARVALLEKARILEVWELPEHAVGLCADTPTCVIIAEITGKPPKSEQCIRVFQTISRRKEAVWAIRDAGVTTWSYPAYLRSRAQGQESTQGVASLTFSPVDDIWRRLTQRGAFFSAISEAVWGFTHTKAHGDPDPVFSPSPGTDFVPCMRQQSGLHPYSVTKEDWRESNPDTNLYWKRGTGRRPAEANWPNFESPKICIAGQTNRNTLWQVVAAVDFAKYYPGKHFLAVTLLGGWADWFRSAYRGVKPPDDKAALRWLCGILNSPVGHAWFAKHAGPRGLQSDICDGMPLPAEYDPSLSSIFARIEAMDRPANLGQVPTWDPDAGIVEASPDLFGEGAAAAQPGNDFWKAVAELNNGVLATYGLDDADRLRIRRYLRGIMDPWAEHTRDIATLPTTTSMKVVRGKTLCVDEAGRFITVELSWKCLGHGQPVRISAPAFMPGWSMAAGREFTCRAPAKCTLADLDANIWLLRDFRALPFEYLPVESLEEMVGYKEAPAKK